MFYHFFRNIFSFLKREQISEHIKCSYPLDISLFSLKTVSVQQQTNAYDCGVFVLEFMTRLATNRDPNLSSNINTVEVRIRICNELLSGELLNSRTRTDT